MSIDEIEKMARKIELIHEAEKARAWTHDYPLRETDASILARAILAVLPVVRAVEAVQAARDDWSGSPTAADAHADALWNLNKAYQAMRQRLGGAE